MNRENSLEYARELAEKGNLAASLKLVERLTELDPEDYEAWTVAVYIFIRSAKYGLAYQISKRVLDHASGNSGAWLNHGAICDGLYREKEARQAFARAMKLAMTDQERLHCLLNIGASHVEHGRFADVEFFAKKALEISPNHSKSLANLGFSQLARRQWVPGWKNYRHAIGEEWRGKVNYGGEPEWNGESGKIVAVYGEQGIGDEICFASMIPDAEKVCKKLIVDCNPKLENLFARSFPDARVYGTRADKNVVWLPEDREIEASLPLGQLGEYFRTKDEDFNGKPFLRPDPDRALMWKCLFETKGKPVIGIAWSGGLPKTGAKHRHCPLEDWLPMFEAIDAHWVSLQYKPSGAEIDTFKQSYPWVDLVEYPYATLTNDYDDTAALVAALDCVVSVPTAIWHLAGGLGMPLVAMKASVGCWKTAAGIPFHPVMKFIEWAGSWRQTISQSVEAVEDLCTFTSVTIPDSPSAPMSSARASNGTLHVQ